MNVYGVIYDRAISTNAHSLPHSYSRVKRATQHIHTACNANNNNVDGNDGSSNEWKQTLFLIHFFTPDCVQSCDEALYHLVVSGTNSALQAHTHTFDNIFIVVRHISLQILFYDGRFFDFFFTFFSLSRCCWKFAVVASVEKRVEMVG